MGRAGRGPSGKVSGVSSKVPKSAGSQAGSLATSSGLGLIAVIPEFNLLALA